jgi:hypothetical protein
VTSSGMQRYRVFMMNFDTRARILGQVIDSDWEQSVKEMWEQNQSDIRRGLAQEYGEYGINQKIENFTECGAVPISIVDHHHRFLLQIRDSFTISSYYPALTGASALGERILNHLVIRLRDRFRHTPEYKTVHRKGSFQDWDKAIEVLDAWGVLLPEAASKLSELGRLRNREAVHFNPRIDADDREPALRAYQLVARVVEVQFAPMGSQPWFIPETPGVGFVRRDFESDPFVEEFILPSARLVGPKHTIEFDDNQKITVVADPLSYPDRDVSDDEFVASWKQPLRGNDP